jgi:hypothetical protein
MATKVKKTVAKAKKVVKPAKKTEKLQQFSVETVTTFYEVHIVQAKDQEEAEFIAMNSDYNISKYLGTQIVQIAPCSNEEMNRFEKVDDYFFQGVATIDEGGYLIYKNLDGTINTSMKPQKIR